LPAEQNSLFPAEAATALKADDANGGNGGIAVVGCASLMAGGGLIN